MPVRSEPTTAIQDLQAMKTRLAEREADDAQLSLREADQLQMVVDGRTAAQTQELAQQLIAGNLAVAVMDPSAELRTTGEARRVNRKAREILGGQIGLIELREGYVRVKPLFEQAASHVPAIAKALANLEDVVRAFIVDLQTFEAEHGNLNPGYPNEPVPYDVYKLIPGKRWMGDVIGGGEANPTRIERWRLEAREYGFDV